MTGRVSSLSKMRETIAARMRQSVTEAPHFYVTISVNMDEAIRLQQQLKMRAGFEHASLNHLIIKAAAYALNREPRVNSSIRNGRLFEPAGVNIGIVTSLPEGLLIPVIRDADKISFRQIITEAKAAVDRARAGRPTSSDLTGGTFSISNMGMLDVENFTAIINPGQGAVLAVSAIKDTPVVEDSQIKIAKMMKVTLSSDHRVIDGIIAAKFLQSLRQFLQTPGVLFA